jgi:hypothetical protein
MNCRLFQIAMALELIVVASCSCPINYITNPDPPIVKQTRDDISLGAHEVPKSHLKGKNFERVPAQIMECNLDI